MSARTLRDKIAAHVAAYPDRTCAAIAGDFGELPSIVSVHLRALRIAGVLEKTGATRGARWRVAEKS